MRPLDLVIAMAAGGFAIYWCAVGLVMRHTGRHPEAALVWFGAAYAVFVAVAALMTTAQTGTLAGVLVRVPYVAGLGLIFGMVNYLRLKAAGRLPAGGRAGA